MIKYKKEIVTTMEAESLKNEIDSLKINKGEMAKSIGIIQTTLSHWLSGRRRIPEKYFEPIEMYINNYKNEKLEEWNELEHILTEVSIEEIDDAIREIDWLCKYDITDRSSDIVIAALKYVKKLKEMDGDEND